MCPIPLLRMPFPPVSRYCHRVYLSLRRGELRTLGWRAVFFPDTALPTPSAKSPRDVTALGRDSGSSSGSIDSGSDTSGSDSSSGSDEGGITWSNLASTLGRRMTAHAEPKEEVRDESKGKGKEKGGVYSSSEDTFRALGVVIKREDAYLGLLCGFLAGAIHLLVLRRRNRQGER